VIPLKDINPSRSFPIMTIAIIAANVLVFVYEASLGKGIEAFILTYGAIPVEITSGARLVHKGLPPALNLITSQFLHGGFLHLLGNMWFLWIFGDNVEDAMGKLRFLFFYLLCGVAAALTHIAFTPHSDLPLVGASGAIAGVLGSYFLLHPRAKVLTFVFFFPFIFDIIAVPAVIFLGFWFLLQVLYAPFGGAVAWFAHIGGFVCGLALTFLFVRRKPRRLTRAGRMWR